MLCNKDCDLKSCRSVDDYIKNLGNCRETAAAYRYLTVGLSMIPLTGISNFYRRNSFDALFELAKGLVTLISICDQICKKGSYTRTTSIHRFCHHSIATLMNNPCMCE